MFLHFNTGRPAVAARRLETVTKAEAGSVEPAAPQVPPRPLAPAVAGDFCASAQVAWPAERMASRVLRNMLDIYAAKYGLEVPTMAFGDPQARAERLRALCDGLPPGGCRLVMASTFSGHHIFVVALVRDTQGTPRCLLADSMGQYDRSVVQALEAAFDNLVYVTPQIERNGDDCSMVTALRFVLMSRKPDLGLRILQTMEAVDARAGQPWPEARQMYPDDMAPLAGWLAPTRYRQYVEPPEQLLGLPLDNGGKNGRRTLEQFFATHPDTFLPDMRKMFGDVDLLMHVPAPTWLRGAAREAAAERRAYLEKRFLRHLPRAARPANPPPG